MQNVTAEMAKNTRETARRANSTLDQRYRQIGIPAVAAAARYQGSAKNPAYAPVRRHWDDRAGEAA